MSLQYHIANRAATDLDSIWDYIAGDNPDTSDRVIARLTASFQRLARWPQLGRVRADLGMALRSFAVGHHVIFHRPVPDGIDIVRVLHGARDLPSALA